MYLFNELSLFLIFSVFILVFLSLLQEYSDVIDNLKKKLDLYRNGSGIYVNDENYKQIVNQTKDKNQTILALISEIRARTIKLKSIDVSSRSIR